MGLSNIYEGWKNHLFPSEYLKDQITSTSDYRLAICRTCPLNSIFHNTMRLDEHCTDCGCSLLPKTKCLSCSCPKEKWTAVVTQEEEQKIANSDGKEV